MSRLPRLAVRTVGWAGLSLVAGAVGGWVAGLLRAPAVEPAGDRMASAPIRTESR